MTIACNMPLLKVCDSAQAEEQLHRWLKGKSPSKENRRDFAKSHLGRQGLPSLSKLDMEDFYPGTMHLGIRAAESLCTRISHCAKGRPTLVTILLARELTIIVRS